jgi:hypothetical protein
MKSRFKNIILTIATISICSIDNVGFGSFDRVDARPKYSIPEITDTKVVPNIVLRKRYADGLKYARGNKYGREFITEVWNEGAERLLPEKIRAAIEGKYLERGDRIYDVNLKPYRIDVDAEYFSFDPTTRQGSIVRKMTFKSKFKTTNSVNPALRQESIFLGEFGIRTEVKFYVTSQTLSDDLILVNNVTVAMNDLFLASNADDITETLVTRFWSGKRDEIIAEMNSRNSLDKPLWAGYIKSALDRTVPPNILNR